MNNSYITIIKEKRTVLSRKRVPLNQNECTADFRIGVPFEQNLQYRVEREDKAGKGFVDFIFYPENPADTGLILELKAGHSPEEAIRQIREKRYALRFRGKPGEKERYTGQILGVGISYDKDTKEHHCKIEQL